MIMKAGLTKARISFVRPGIAGFFKACLEDFINPCRRFE